MSIFGGAKPPSPPPPPPVPKRTSEEVVGAQANERRRLGKGRQSTILTAPDDGLSIQSGALNKKTLLGE